MKALRLNIQHVVKIPAGFFISVSAAQQLNAPANRSQRRFELVCHIGHKLAAQLLQAAHTGHIGNHGQHLAVLPLAGDRRDVHVILSLLGASGRQCFAARGFPFSRFSGAAHPVGKLADEQASIQNAALLEVAGMEQLTRALVQEYNPEAPPPAAPASSVSEARPARCFPP